MRCQKCNTELEENAIFCPNCGISTQEENNVKREESSPMSEYAGYIIIALFCVLPIIYLIVFGISTSENPQSVLTSIEFVLLIVAIIYCKKIKNVVLNVARWLLDFTTTFDALLGISILIVGIFVCKETYINYWWFVLGAILYSLIALIKDYALYLLVDIRDSLKILADNKKADKE